MLYLIQHRRRAHKILSPADRQEAFGMDKIKKASIVTGAVVGGVIGGAVSLVGTLAHNKFLDRLGEDIVDSTILTASITGNALSGTAHLAAGAAKRDPQHLSSAKEDFADVGRGLLKNFKTNMHLILDNSGEILLGIKDRDGRRILNGAKTLGKIIAISTITVGAVQINTDNDSDAETKPKKAKEKAASTASCEASKEPVETACRPRFRISRKLRRLQKRKSIDCTEK